MEGVKRLASRSGRGGAFEVWTVRLLLPALVLALLATVAAVAGFRYEELPALFDGPERGTWLALSLNGEDVAARGFLVRVEGGDVVAGHDGCNAWGRTGETDPASGRPITTTTLVACDPIPYQQAYRRLAFGDAAMQVGADGRLALRIGDTAGTFRRWTGDDTETQRDRAERPGPARSAPPPPSAPPPAPSPPLDPVAANFPTG
ncbi:hypothetical protein [Aurantiacibacter spongiae]|uniref:META domain-containing protein n=1 Tax=Aurantiacibacter spongiae TaxID=2488860 RepID=A0A3N5DBU3_9SPHN|nr:hypothetical protein [Aurantiacibacter spongiae]RPF72238.1 hypothetical protein EG799_11840 [Aurantiacibacter spongiae]